MTFDVIYTDKRNFQTPCQSLCKTHADEQRTDKSGTLCYGNGISKSKPDPEVFLRAAQLLGLQPAQCLVVEDATAGILAAYRGGFDSAGLGDAALDKLTTYPLQQFSQLNGILLQH